MNAPLSPSVVHAIAAEVARERGLPLEAVCPSPLETAVISARAEIAQRIALTTGMIGTPDTRQKSAAIIATVASECGILPPDILGSSRKPHIAHPRQEVMRRLRELGYSYPRIGRILARDHTTVLHGVRAARARLRGDAA